MGSWISPFSPLSRIGLYSSVPWLFLIVWLKVWTLLILFKLMKTRSLKNACFGKMATVLAILVRRKNLTHGWNSHIIYLTRQSIKTHTGQFLGLASSPYVTSTVCLSVRPSVSNKKFSYFPPLDFSDFLHEVSLQ